MLEDLVNVLHSGGFVVKPLSGYFLLICPLKDDSTDKVRFENVFKGAETWAPTERFDLLGTLIKPDAISSEALEHRLARAVTVGRQIKNAM